MSSKKNIVIIGGGYAGADLALKLERQAHVTLIEPRESLFHVIGVPRALVQPAFTSEILLSYAEMFRNKDIEHVREAARAIDVEQQLISVGRKKSKREIAFDYLIVACGGQNKAAAQENELTSDEQVAAALRAKHDAYMAADKIVVVGGGAVGLEMAAEMAVASKQKQVVVVHSNTHGRLIESDADFAYFKEKFHRKLLAKVAAIENLSVVFDRVERNDDADDADDDDNAARSVALRKGGAIDDVDLVIWAVGSSLRHDWLPAQFAVSKSGIAVNKFLQVQKADGSGAYDNIFAAGDIADWPGDERNMSIYATAHAANIAVNLGKLLANKKPGSLAEYKTSKRLVMFIPLGPKGGVASLPNGWVFGDTIARIKSKDYFTKKVRSDFGL